MDGQNKFTRAVTHLDLKCREVREGLCDSSRCSDGERGGPEMCQVVTTAPLALLSDIADIYKVLITHQTLLKYFR